MTDREFAEAFESLAFPPEAFHHADHVRLAWIYLQSGTLLEAIERFTTSLQRFAASLGKADLYHATITWAYLLLIHERIQRNPAGTFEAFRAANADLFRWKPSVLANYYRDETLGSALARRTFVLPDIGTPMAV